VKGILDVFAAHKSASPVEVDGTLGLTTVPAEGNHGVSEGKILRFKVVDVAEHLSLRVVGVEDRVRL
jgi:hypothetical protein